MGWNSMYTPEETLEASTEPQRRVASPGADPPRRPKRGKYTARACEQCKKRKLKCAPRADYGDCERCAASGLICDNGSGTSQAGRDRGENNPDVGTLCTELKRLSRQVTDLTGTVNELKGHLNCPDNTSPPQSIAATSSTAVRHDVVPQANLQHRPDVPKQPQFIGPTRSAYSFELGERSLTDMGIPAFDLQPPSGAQSPVGSPSGDTSSGTDFWQRCSTSEISRLLGVFQEEIESVYPCIDSQSLAASAAQILQYGRLGECGNGVVGPSNQVQGFGFKDFQLAKIAIAIAIVIEEHGSNEESQMVISSFEDNPCWIPNAEVNLKEIQHLAILSIYYFLRDEDLLAWRTIGAAARGALEMGLHRKETLVNTFEDDGDRSMAIRVFWCVYVLDRRWSFGTSLSFALVDRDIDPELPEPGSDYQYLQCLVGYGRLSSKLWDALITFGSSSYTIPEEMAMSLDFMTQEWLESIPPHLRLRHPRLGMGSRSQPRLLHRLRALLYLRGNHTRILIYRHHLLSARCIKANLRSARLVVEIARDSVDVLVHLHATSNIYSRQQNPFNYFLLSALAVIFLAVCHEPVVFAEPCRETFHAAVDLVRGFSRHTKVSRRLWHSIRGLLPRLRRLGMRSAEEQPRQIEAGDGQPGEDRPRQASSVGGATHDDQILHGSGYTKHLAQHQPSYQGEPGTSMQVPVDGFPGSNTDDQSGFMPNMFQVSNDLMALFNVFEQNPQFPAGFDPDLYTGSNSQDAMMYGEGEMWRRFHGLI